MNRTTYGLDLAKRVFQVHWVDIDTGEVKRRTLRRGEVLRFFALQPGSVVAMEACGSAHYWGRALTNLGHDVKLIAAQFVRPFVKTNKTDTADAQAIWEAAQRPEMRRVALKTVEQQAVLGLHRVRQQLVKQRTMHANQVRGLLYEFGVVMPQGWKKLLAEAGQLLADDDQMAVPKPLAEVMGKQLSSIQSLSERIDALERRIGLWQRGDVECQRISAIPGVGPLSATAVIATIGNANGFRSGRELAAFFGLVPRQSGTGGRVKLLGISKRGDPYVRTLLIHAARSVLVAQTRNGRELDPWVKQLLGRRPWNVVLN
jgi:transposase